MSSPLRVIQCGTGTAGLLALRAIIDSPQLELAGLLVTSPEKVGRDAGDIADRPTTGIVATDQVESLFSSRADCVCYMLLTPDLEHISGFLQAAPTGLLTPCDLLMRSLLQGKMSGN